MCEIGAATLAHETLAEEEDDVDWACKMADGRCPAEIGSDCWEAATQWGSALDGAAWGGRSETLEAVAAGMCGGGFAETLDTPELCE